METTVRVAENTERRDVCFGVISGIRDTTIQVVVHPEKLTATGLFPPL